MVAVGRRATPNFTFNLLAKWEREPQFLPGMVAHRMRRIIKVISIYQKLINPADGSQSRAPDVN
jgi:hypothetical protein